MGGDLDSAIDMPPYRRLRGYAFDPSLETRLETAVLNRITFKVPWEKELEPGPVGEYLEVVDYDPPSKAFYAPVDLNHPFLLAQDGVSPSEGNPQFHQQFVYAVAMTTIGNFERALGRVALWSERLYKVEGKWKDAFVPRLRVYPHALREANAYYSPDKKALLFGYFPANPLDRAKALPGGVVFTCLSHDIVAHETTHALLDGLHRRYIEATNPDVLAFHEAFADIVALFQHFSFPEVLRSQIAKTRGDLASQNLLGALAQEFGQSIGHYGALRDALGEFDEQGNWKPLKPDPTALERTLEPHDRGAILVAAVFDAFMTIYKSRIADLLRIASNGTGVLPLGDIHPDLVNRLSTEAAKTAQHVLNMCIRALDYCPPCDLTFGDYLRALVTADFELVRDDDRSYRVALIEAFRRRGIYPQDVRTLSVDSLRWNTPTSDQQKAFQESLYIGAIAKMEDLTDLWQLRDVSGRKDKQAEEDPSSEAPTYRETIYNSMKKNAAILRGSLSKRFTPEVARLMGLNLEAAKAERSKRWPIEVHSVRPARRIGPDGNQVEELVIVVTQRRPLLDNPSLSPEEAMHQGPWFRGGCTLLVDMHSGHVRYCIAKDINSTQRLEQQRDFVQNRLSLSLHNTYFGRQQGEPFALLHRRGMEEHP